MDIQVGKRRWRFEDVALHKDTTRQWDLVAAAVEEANVIYNGLTGKEATSMRGRSKITFKERVRHLLGGMGNEDAEAEVGRLAKLRKTAGAHTVLGNKLINVARRIKANIKHTEDPQKLQPNHKLNAATMEAYSEQADNISGRLHLTAEQRQRIEINKQNAVRRKEAKANKVETASGECRGMENPAPQTPQNPPSPQ